MGRTEAARRLGVSVRTLQVWVQWGYVRRVRLLSGRYRYSLHEIERVNRLRQPQEGDDAEA